MTKDVIGKASIGLDMRLKNRFFFFKEKQLSSPKSIDRHFFIKMWILKDSSYKGNTR